MPQCLSRFRYIYPSDIWYYMRNLIGLQSGLIIHMYMGLGLSGLTSFHILFSNLWKWNTEDGKRRTKIKQNMSQIRPCCTKFQVHLLTSYRQLCIMCLYIALSRCILNHRDLELYWAYLYVFRIIINSSHW